MSLKTRAALTLACTLAAACNDAPSTGIKDLRGVPSFAVHVSAFGQTTGVTLLDGEGAVLNELFVSSATELPGISAALASDIALPSQVCDPSRLTVVGRYGSNTLLQISFDDTQDIRQFSTQLSGSDGEGAYQSNPQDILCLDGDRALISRFEPNLLPGAGALDLGDDLIVVDLVKGEILSRIALDGLRVKLAGGELAYARPGSIVRRGKYAVVGLALASSSFEAASPGELALIKLDDFSVEKVAFEALANCGNVIPVVDRDDAVIVSCAGAPYGDPGTAGLAFVTVDDEGDATVVVEFQATADGAALFASPTSTGGGSVIVAAMDASYTAPDVAYTADVLSGRYEKAFDGTEAGGVGSGAMRFATGLVLIPDTGVGVRVFQRETDGSLSEGEPVALRTDLPPRAIRAVRDVR